MIIVVLMIDAMSYEGGRDSRQADRIMGMVGAVPGLSRGRGGRERHSAETSGGGNSEGQHSFTVHEANSFSLHIECLPPDIGGSMAHEV